MPAADELNDEGWVVVVAVVLVVAVDLLRSGEVEWLAASLLTRASVCPPATRSLLVLVLETTVILRCNCDSLDSLISRLFSFFVLVKNKTLIVYFSVRLCCGNKLSVW